MYSADVPVVLERSDQITEVWAIRGRTHTREAGEEALKKT